jgi:hypothetical protein
MHNLPFPSCYKSNSSLAWCTDQQSCGGCIRGSLANTAGRTACPAWRVCADAQAFAARRLGVHPGETHTLVGEFVDARRLVTANGIQLGYPQVAEANIVDQDVEDIRRFATVLPAELGQFFINGLVVPSPLFAVLGLQDILLGVVDELAGRLKTGAKEACHHQTTHQCYQSAHGISPGKRFRFRD